MDKMREKARQILTDVKLGKQDDSGAVHVKEDSLLGNLQSYCVCCYCRKAFLNSKYLLKHLLRRHTDDLLLLHDKLLGISKPDSGDEHLPVKSIINILNEHFDIIKKELENVKQHVANETSDKSSDELKQSINELSVTKKDKTGKNTELNFADEIISVEKCKELSEIKTKIFEVESFMKLLSAQMEKLQTVVKDNLTFKQEVLEKISLDEDKILQNQKMEFLKLKQIFMSELQHNFLDKLDENTPWGQKYPDLKNELNKIDHVIESNYRQINSPDFLKELEQKFEKKLCWLIENSKLSCSCKNHSKYPDEHSESMLMRHSKSNFKGLKKSNDQVINVGVVPGKNSMDIKFLLEQKLQNLNIAPDANRIPTAQYVKKMQLLSTERELLCKKYKNFMEVYSNIHSDVHRKTLAKLRKRKPKKIKFSRPTKLLQYKMHQIPFNSHEMGTRLSKKQESAEFILTDVGASGDFESSPIPANEDDASILSSDKDSVDKYTNKRDPALQHPPLHPTLDLPMPLINSDTQFLNLEQKNFDELSLQSLSSLSDEEFQRSPSSYFKPIINNT